MPNRDWFKRLTGFHERNYEETQSRLRVEGDELVSTVNNKRYQQSNLFRVRESQTPH